MQDYKNPHSTEKAIKKSKCKKQIYNAKIKNGFLLRLKPDLRLRRKDRKDWREWE